MRKLLYTALIGIAACACTPGASHNNSGNKDLYNQPLHTYVNVEKDGTLVEYDIQRSSRVLTQKAYPLKQKLNSASQYRIIAQSVKMYK